MQNTNNTDNSIYHVKKKETKYGKKCNNVVPRAKL